MKNVKTATAIVLLAAYVLKKNMIGDIKMDEALRLAIDQLDDYFYNDDHHISWPVMTAYKTVRNSLCGEQPVVVGLNIFLGRHNLSGVEYTTVEDEDEYQYEAFKFCLDGITYIVSKDPEDGYRSRCREIIISKTPCSVYFPPQEVVGLYDDDMEEVIKFVDIHTGKTVMRFGTENSNDYYPYCVMEWIPENLSAN